MASLRTSRTVPSLAPRRRPSPPSSGRRPRSRSNAGASRRVTSISTRTARTWMTTGSRTRRGSSAATGSASSTTCGSTSRSSRVRGACARAPTRADAGTPLRLAVLRSLAPDLFEPRVAPAAEAVGLVVHGVLLAEVLMVLLGGIEGLERLDLDGDRSGERLRFLDLPLRGLGEPRLRVVRGEDHGPVLAADVAELTVRRRGIDVVAVDVEELLVGDPAGIEENLDRFRMAGLPRRDLFVGRILGVAARIARRRRDHPLDAVEGRLHAPEAASRENRLF